jgi:hypothetical protein
MNETQKTGFAERLKTAADAKKLLLERMKPKTAVVDPQHAERAALRASEKAAELAQVREERAAARAATKQAAADAEAAIAQAIADQEASDLDAKRGQRKERKALTKVEAKAARDAKYAARKARQ